MKKDPKKNGQSKITRREFVKKGAEAALVTLATGCAHPSILRNIASGGRDEHEYIVIGSGAGGGPVAHNLAKAGFKVALIEAGDAQFGPKTTVPALNLLSTEDPEMSWQFFVKHYTDSSHQRADSKYNQEKGGVFYPRAGTVGGCTAHNVLVTLYPDNEDWDYISAMGGAGMAEDRSWSSDNMRNYFQRLERNRYLKRSSTNPTRAGFDGWLSTEMANPELLFKDGRLLAVVTEAAKCGAVTRQLATEIVEAIGEVVSGRQTAQQFYDRFSQLKLDPNDWNYVSNKPDKGLFVIPKASDNGVRSGTRELVLDAKEKHGLKLYTNCLATRLIFDPTNASRIIGVEYLEGQNLYRADPNFSKSNLANAKKKTVFATKEVILAGGAFNSPQLLMVSGIGNESELRKHGISTRIHLPGVGKNLQDRYEIGVVLQLEGELNLIKNCTFDGSSTDPCMNEYLAASDKNTTPYSSNGPVAAILKKSSSKQSSPDLCIFGYPGRFRGYYNGYAADAYRKDQLTWSVLKGHTRNKSGTVSLTSDKPWDTPDINFRYFGDGSLAQDEDLDAVLEGVRTIREMNNSLLIRGISKGEVVPGPEIKTDDDIRNFIRRETWGHHASCTNKMGPREEGGVVDKNFLVHGTENLRIVDASVFPKIPGLFIVVPIYMIAEKASDVIIAASGK